MKRRLPVRRTLISYRNTSITHIMTGRGEHIDEGDDVLVLDVLEDAHLNQGAMRGGLSYQKYIDQLLLDFLVGSTKQ